MSSTSSTDLGRREQLHQQTMNEARRWTERESSSVDDRAAQKPVHHSSEVDNDILCSIVMMMMVSDNDIPLPRSSPRLSHTHKHPLNDKTFNNGFYLFSRTPNCSRWRFLSRYLMLCHIVLGGGAVLLPMEYISHYDYDIQVESIGWTRSKERPMKRFQRTTLGKATNPQGVSV